MSTLLGAANCLPSSLPAYRSILFVVFRWAMLVASLASCDGAGGKETIESGSRLQIKKSVVAQSGIDSSLQVEVSPPDIHCANGGFKIVSLDNTSADPVYVCSDGTKRVYEVANTEAFTLPPTGPLKSCDADGATECLAFGNFKVVDSARLDPTKIAAGATIAGVAGSALTPPDCTADGQLDCVSVVGFTAANTTALAAKILAGNSVAGIPGIYTPPGLADVKKGVQFGVTGLLQTGTYPSAGNLLAGSAGTDLPGMEATTAAGSYQFFKSDGTRMTGAITDAGTISAAGSSQNFDVSLYKGFSVGAANLETHSTCTSDGAVGCVTDANYKSAKMSDFDTWSIVAGKTIAGIAGSAYVGSLLSSGARHNANTTPGNMTYAQELGLGASTLWRTITTGNTGYGYREVPVVATDDDGYNPDSPMQSGKLVRNRIVAQRSDGTALVASSTILTAPAGTFTNVAVNDSVGIISSSTGKITPKLSVVSATNNDTTVTLNAGFVTVDATGIQFFVERPASTGSWDVGIERKVCGKSAANVTDKIANCATHNPSVATWNGVVKGIAGEGSWTLVTVYSASLADAATCDATCYEVWRDNRTGLLWSDLLKNGVTTTFNWCHATGANNSAGTVDSAYRGSDPSGYCAPTSGTGPGSIQTDPPTSLCFEDTGFVTDTAFDPMKGNMHKHASSSGTVKWRVPTKEDYQVADHNGLRQVLPNMSNAYWAGTIDSTSTNRANAWRMSLYYLGITSLVRTNSYAVRCVGTE